MPNNSTQSRQVKRPEPCYIYGGAVRFSPHGDVYVRTNADAYMDQLESSNAAMRRALEDSLATLSGYNIYGKECNQKTCNCDRCAARKLMRKGLESTNAK